MLFSPELNRASLIKRYKRFLADVTIDTHSNDKQAEITTMHVANTGAMTGCADSNDIVWFSTSSNAKRKYPYSWELTEKPNGDFICVNTLRANQVVEEALTNNVITQLKHAKTINREVKYGEENSKIDFLLTFEDQADTYIEVKSVTLLTHNQGYFPDAVTTRGQKHLRELITMVEQGHRAVLLFAVLHTGINSVKVAEHIDPKYANLLTKAEQAGVEILLYKAEISPKEIKLTHQLP